MSEILPPVIINNNPNLIIPALHEAGNYVGPIFQTGTQGPQGLAATISVGTVTTGAPGSLVIVNNRGTSSVAIFDFTIPRGDVGAQGPKGDTGDAATIDVGTVTTGAAGSDVVITNAGNIHDAILNFTIPRGDKGEKGDKGDQGIQGIQGLKGDQGIQGLKGDQGIQGLKGDQGIQGSNGADALWNFRGAWVNGYDYAAGDLVTYNGSLYYTATGVYSSYYPGYPGVDWVLAASKGDQGIQGLKGDTGDQGIQGIQGLKGIQGIQGEKGDTGDQGLPGSGVAGNHDVGVIYLKNNATATTIPSINGRAVVAGTMQTGTLYNFEKDATTNSLKYTGDGGRFHVVASFNFYSGTNDTCGFYIGKNTVPASALDPNADRISESEVYAEARNQNKPSAAAVQTVLDLNPGDRIFFIVQNKDSTASIKVEFLKFVAVTLTSEKGDVGPEGPPAPYVDPVRTTVTGNGSTSVYAISGASGLTNPSALIVAIDGALQEPSVDYTVSGGNITFTSPLPNGSKAVVVSPVNTIQVGQVTPSDGSVTSAKIANSVTLTTPSLVGPVDLTSQDASTADRVMTRTLGDARYCRNFIAGKTSETARGNTNTPTSDPTLIIAIPEAGNYIFEVFLRVRTSNSGGGTVSGLKFGLLYSGSATLASSYIGWASSVASSFARGALDSFGSYVDITTLNFAENQYTIKGMVTATTAGDFSLSWSPYLINATETTILKVGSSITMTKTA